MSVSKTLVTTVAIGSAVVLTACTATDNSSSVESPQEAQPTPMTQTETSEGNLGLEQETQSSASNYTNGVYTSEGRYQTPAGQERINVTLTLENDIVTQVEVEELAVAPMSQKMQADFASHYKEQVVGKNIADIKLTKVSGSSLTPNGFNSALEDIKTQAQAQS